MSVNGLPREQPLPIQYPVCMIAGQSYVAKYGLGAFAKMERMGLNPAKIQEEVAAWQAAGKPINLILTLASAALGNFEKTATGFSRWVPLGMSPKELEDFIPDEDWQGVMDAVLQSLGKVPQAQPANPPAPAETGGTPPIPPVQ